MPKFVDWEHLNLNYTVKARIDQDLCIQCGRCYIACEDTSHQAIRKEHDGQRYFEVIDEECVGCNLCVNVCPVESCITLQPLPAGTIDPRTDISRWRVMATGRRIRTIPVEKRESCIQRRTQRSAETQSKRLRRRQSIATE